MLVVAMIMMGDPRHVPGKAYDVGTSTQNGLFPRNGTCDKYASKIQSYCDTGDPFCSGGKNLTVHVGYVKEYGAAAMNFTDMKMKSSSS